MQSLAHACGTAPRMRTNQVRMRFVGKHVVLGKAKGQMLTYVFGLALGVNLLQLVELVLVGDLIWLFGLDELLLGLALGLGGRGGGCCCHGGRLLRLCAGRGCEAVELTAREGARWCAVECYVRRP